MTFNRFDATINGLEERGYRMDAGRSSLVEKALTKTLSNIQETVYNESIAPQALPFAVPEGTGLTSIEHYMSEETGELQLIGPNSSDLPSSGEKLTPVSRSVANYGGKFFYSLHEFERFMRMNSNGFQYDFNGRRGRNAGKIAMRKIENVVLSEGDEKDPRIKGFFAYSLNAVTGMTGGWATATETEMLDDLKLLYQKSFDGSSGADQDPDTMILPRANYGLLKSTFRANTDRTLLRLFEDELGVKIYGSARLNSVTSATNSLSAAPTGICYKKDMDLLSVHVPRPFELRPGRWTDDDKYQVNYYLDFSGLFIDYLPNIALIDLS